MTWFLKFVFWFAIGAIGSGAGITLYLLSALRRMELFPSVAGAAVVAGLLLLVVVRSIVWLQSPQGRRDVVETFSIEEPALQTMESR